MDENKRNQPKYDFETEGVLDGVAYKAFGVCDGYKAILVKFDTPFHFKLRPEKFTDKIFKIIGSAYEFQTGDSPFDNRFFIIGRDKIYRQALSSRSVRNRITALAPFIELFVGPDCIFVKHAITNCDDCERIDEKGTIRNLIKLGQTIKEIKI